MRKLSEVGLFSLVVILASLAGCGQKGALYLSDEPISLATLLNDPVAQVNQISKDFDEEAKRSKRLSQEGLSAPVIDNSVDDVIGNQGSSQ